MSKVNEEKVREFWISEKPKDYGNQVYCLDNPTDGYIHVIEKSAFDTLKAKADKLAEALDWACGHIEGVTRKVPPHLEKALKDYRGEK